MPSFVTACRSALRRRCLGTITEFRTDRPVAALTFDDGPDPAVTPRVLDLLEAHGARATFFVIGEAAVASRPLLWRMRSDGHAVGNHTWSHQPMSTLTRSQRRREILACSRAIAPFGSRLLRPPWGDQSVASRLDAFVLRHEVVAWSVDANDWCSPDAGSIAENLEQRVRPGSVILLHDHICSAAADAGAATVCHDRGAMLAALELFLRHLRGRLTFVTLPEMFHHGHAVRRDWFRSRLGASATDAKASGSPSPLLGGPSTSPPRTQSR